MKENVTKGKVAVNEFDRKIIFLPGESTCEDQFYGGFKPFPHPDVRAELLTLNPVRDLINDVLVNLPEEIQSDFPSNLKKRLKGFGKTVGLPRFARQFRIKSELYLDCSRKYRWTPKDNEPINLNYDESKELREIIKSGFTVRLMEFQGNDICFISEELIQKQSDPVKEILELWRLPNSRGIIEGRKYQAIGNSFLKINSFVPYFQIHAIHLRTYVRCKKGGDAVHHIGVRLPERKVFKICPGWWVADMQWETRQGKETSQHASFEEAVKKLVGV